MPSGESVEPLRFADDDEPDDLGGFSRGKRSYDDDDDEDGGWAINEDHSDRLWDSAEDSDDDEEADTDATVVAEGDEEEEEEEEDLFGGGAPRGRRGRPKGSGKKQESSLAGTGPGGGSATGGGGVSGGGSSTTGGGASGSGAFGGGAGAGVTPGSTSGAGGGSFGGASRSSSSLGGSSGSDCWIPRFDSGRGNVWWVEPALGWWRRFQRIGQVGRVEQVRYLHTIRWLEQPQVVWRSQEDFGRVIQVFTRKKDRPEGVIRRPENIEPSVEPLGRSQVGRAEVGCAWLGRQEISRETGVQLAVARNGRPRRRPQIELEGPVQAVDFASPVRSSQSAVTLK
jgi:hypothetical protein